ncbi:hypothetical protein O6H91_06G124800 [Diphasiastrum complanatum]|uniref:Uncharacterized protein n=2 Tax=Diphasiastrum complanatum TaxID=34168 RepID=A0ACC2DJF8_DIPCM|nr:hypothetical protein O6H91_06G124800 [Diphasiastrum complanatum]
MLTSMAWLRGSRRVQGFCKFHSLGSSSFLSDLSHQHSLQSASLLDNELEVHLRSYVGAAFSEKLPNFVGRHSGRSIKGRSASKGTTNDKAIHEGKFVSVAVLNETRGERFIVKSSLAEVDTNKSTHFEEFDNSRTEFDTNKGSVLLQRDAVLEENVSDPAIDGTDSIKWAEQNGQVAYEFGNREEVTSLVHSADGKSVGDITQAETNLEEEFEGSKDKFHEEPPAKSIARNLPEESPSEAIYLRKRVGKIPGEIEGHGRILEKIRSLGACSTLPQKHENETSYSEMHDLDHDRQIGSEEKFDAPEHLGSLKGFPSEINGTDQKKKPFLSADLQPPRHRAYVKFLNPTATNDDLQQAFADCGEIVKAQAVKPTKQNTRFTYGFVDFKTAAGLSRALRKNAKIKGFKVEIEPSPLHTSDGISNWNLDFSILKKLEPTSTSSSHSASLLSMLKSSSTEKVNNSADNFDISKVISLMRAAHATKPEDLKKSEQTVTNSQNAYVVGIRDLPTAVNLHQVQQALSVFGEIAHSYMTKGEHDSSDAYVEFMLEEAKENALALHCLYINGLQLRISRIDSPKSAVIRISNIHRDTAKSEILSACMACGQVARIEPRIEGVVDVYFERRELKNVNTILDRLNEIVRDHKRWMANPAPIYENGAAHDDQFIRLQKDKLFKDIQKFLQHINMYFEDLNRLDKADEIIKS